MTLPNIYLHRFDTWVETVLIPEYTRGKKQRPNAQYQRICGTLYRMRKRGIKAGVRKLIQQRRTLPSIDTRDERYRRLRYVRYADDFVRHEARFEHGAQAPPAGRRAGSLSL